MTGDDDILFIHRDGTSDIRKRWDIAGGDSDTGFKLTVAAEPAWTDTGATVPLPDELSIPIWSPLRVHIVSADPSAVGSPQTVMRVDLDGTTQFTSRGDGDRDTGLQLWVLRDPENEQSEELRVEIYAPPRVRIERQA